MHAAADTEYDWPFYGGLAGAYFDSHPAIQPATVRVEDRAHPATAHLDGAWNRTDEWYNYRTNPRERAHVLATLDESTYSGGNMNGDHPLSWCQEYRGGRAFYTGAGHTKESYAEPAFRTHLLGGIRYATGAAQADCRPEQGYRPLFDGTSTDGWKQAGPGSFTLDDGTLTSSGGMGLLWYEAEGVRRVLPQARLEDDRGRQLRDLRGLPALGRPLDRRRQRLRDPDRRDVTPPTGPPAPSTPSRPPTSRPATPR